MFFVWHKNITYQLICNDLSNEDSRIIILQLLKMHIPYRYSVVSKELLVPENKFNDVYLMLLEKGLPKKSSFGFELLDKEQFSISKFNEKINYQRALEGELSESIQRLNFIRTAKVHLSFQKNSLFISDKMIPSASVIVGIQYGKHLSIHQIQSISYLMSASVPELLPQNVIILDDNGKLLNHIISSENIIKNLELEKIKKQEYDYYNRIKYILSTFISLNDFRIQVIIKKNYIDCNKNIKNKIILDNSKKNIFSHYKKYNNINTISVFVLVNYINNKDGILVPIDSSKIIQIKKIIQYIIKSSDPQYHDKICIMNVKFLKNNFCKNHVDINLFYIYKKFHYYLYCMIFFFVVFLIFYNKKNIFYFNKNKNFSNIILNQKLKDNDKDIVNIKQKNMNNNFENNLVKDKLMEDVLKISKNNPKLIALIIQNWINNKI